MAACAKRFLGKSLNPVCVFYNGIIYMYISISKEAVCTRIRQAKMHTVCSGVFVFLHLMPLTKGRTRQPSGPAPVISIYVLPKVASNPPVKSNMARKKIKLDWKENKQICEFSSLSTTINCFHGLLSTTYTIFGWNKPQTYSQNAPIRYSKQCFKWSLGYRPR